LGNWRHEFFSFKVRFWGLFHAAGFLAVLGTIAGFLGPLAWWLDLGAHFRVQYVLMFAALMVFYGVARKWKWVGGSAVFFLINLIPVLLLLWPRAEPIPVKGPSYRALLINVNTQAGDPLAVIRTIQDSSPDFMVLEEINDDWMRKLEPALTNYPYRVVEPREDNFGIALLSRRPWEGAQVIYVGDAGVPSVAARVLLEQSPILLLGTHALPPGSAEYSAYRNNQLERLADFVRKIHIPVLLIGDLNVSPWSVHFRKLLKDSGLQNSSQGRGLYASWPTFAWPFLIPIDQGLHSMEIRIVNKQVGPNVGSDHYPIIIDFCMN
jgi:endonuclease/exonuclease/phosphatase (EEP) superfamily protein YafD